MSQLHEHVTEASITVAAKTAQYGGGASAVFFGLTANEFAALVGAAIAVGGYLTSLYFQLKRDRRERAEHDLKMLLRKDTL
jgi:hypothetical protein